jgi:hypothetical protein
LGQPQQSSTRARVGASSPQKPEEDAEEGASDQEKPHNSSAKPRPQAAGIYLPNESGGVPTKEAKTAQFLSELPDYY